MEQREVDEVRRVMTRIEDPDFLTPTYIASGHNVVRSVLLETEELKHLLAHAGPAGQLVRARTEGLRTEQTGAAPALITYFVFFERTQDSEALPCLAAYVQSLPDESAPASASPWHPFRYAVRAIEAITKPTLPVPDRQNFASRYALAAAATAWYDQHVQRQQSSPP